MIVGHHFFLEGHGKSSKRRLQDGEISYSRQCITFGSRSVPWRYELSANISKDSRFMKCKVTTTVAPSSMCQVIATLEGEPGLSKPWGFFSLLRSSEADVCFIESFGNFRKNDSVLPRWVCNTSSNAVVIHQGCQYASLTECSPFLTGLMEPAFRTLLKMYSQNRQHPT
jgi:hypothetical protein